MASAVIFVSSAVLTIAGLVIPFTRAIPEAYNVIITITTFFLSFTFSHVLYNKYPTEPTITLLYFSAIMICTITFFWYGKLP